MGEDKGLYVEFSLEAKEDKAASEREGRPIFKDVEYIRIHVPGDKTNVPHRPVNDQDRALYATRYNAWKKGQQDVHSGQPLREWAQIRPAEVSMLAHHNLHTVEALAAVSDENAGRIGPILGLRAKARAHIETSKAAAPVAALNAKLEEERKAREALEAQLAEMRALIAKQGKAMDSKGDAKRG